MTLKKYIAKRIVQLPLFLLIISVIMFLLAYLAPGDPVTVFYLSRIGGRYSYEELDYIKHMLGLDQPIHIQYFRWIWRMIHGDFGQSYIWNQPVLPLIRSSILNTLRMMIPAFVLSILFGIFTGVISAVKQYSKTDHVVMASSLLMWSMPWFWSGLMAIYIFSVYLHLLPTGGMYTVGQPPTVVDQISHLIMPVLLYATSGAGFITRLTRSCMLEVLREDYIMTARMKGLKEKVVIYRHALRNAILPVVTVVSLYVSYLVGGAAVIEFVFAWPGVGRLAVLAATQRDYPVVLGINMVVATIVLIAIFIADISYAYLDPRIRY